MRRTTVDVPSPSTRVVVTPLLSNHCWQRCSFGEYNRMFLNACRPRIAGSFKFVHVTITGAKCLLSGVLPSRVNKSFCASFVKLSKSSKKRTVGPCSVLISRTLLTHSMSCLLSSASTPSNSTNRHWVALSNTRMPTVLPHPVPPHTTSGLCLDALSEMCV